MQRKDIHLSKALASFQKSIMPVIKEKLLIDFMQELSCDDSLQSPDKATVIISRDFEKWGFYNVIVTPPMGLSWTYEPPILCSNAFVQSLHKKPYKHKLKMIEDINEYFISAGILERKVPTGIFHAFNEYGNQEKKVPIGVFWTVSIPLEKLGAFLDWIKIAAHDLLQYTCNLDDRKEEDWNINLFFAGGRDWPLTALERDCDQGTTFMDAKPPIPRMQEELKFLYAALVHLENIYDKQGKRMFCARNAWRQSTVAFPYCDDEYEKWNSVSIDIIKKRVHLIKKIDIPNFYNSINGMKLEPIINAREQLEYMIENNKSDYLLRELGEILADLNDWIVHAEREYGGLLCFE